MKIKVCGITTIEQMQQLQDLGAEYAGMIFYEGSKRYIGGIRKSKAEIRNTGIKKVGVFVNADFDTVVNAVNDYDLTAVQLHGDETDEFCLELMDKVEVIKVFRIADQIDIDDLIAPFQNVCHYFLFDTDTASFGGSGQQFDWNILKNAAINKPFFLSGGIRLEDVAGIRSFRHPFLYAVDVNSRFEVQPGIKDMNKVALFIKAVRDE